MKNVWHIFKSEFFVFANSFAGIYVLNAPKYAIDNYLTEDVQAIFGYIMMPATVITLFTQFVFMPYLNKLKELYTYFAFKISFFKISSLKCHPSRKESLNSLIRASIYQTSVVVGTREIS